MSAQEFRFDTSGLKVEAHALESIELAQLLARGSDIDAHTLLLACARDVGPSSSAFPEWNRILGEVRPPLGGGSSAVLEGAPRATEGLASSLARHRTTLERSGLWGRDLITLALLAVDDPSLNETAELAETTLDDLRGQWFAFLTGPQGGTHRDADEWAEWWGRAGLEDPRETATAPTYLLTWNPEKYAFQELDLLADVIAKEGTAEGSWNTGRRKHVVVDARVYLMRLGVEPKGIVGSGRIIGPVEDGSAPIAWDRLEHEPVIGLDVLAELSDGDGRVWTPQASGTQILPNLSRLLTDVWEARREAGGGDDGPLPTVADPECDRVRWLDRLTPEARPVVDAAATLAEMMGQDTVGTEHLLAAVLARSNSTLNGVLQKIGVDQAAVFDALDPPGGSRLLRSWDAVTVDALPIPTPHAREALVAAERLGQGPGELSVERLVEGLLSVPSSPPVSRLAALGLTRDALPWASPVQIAQAGFGSDAIGGDDQFGLDREVQSLAAVMASSEVNPPLSIGLFGPWGSGKSFFMRLLQEEVERIEDARQPGYCSHIVQIRFNAWHYIDGDLWASLANEVFEQLGRAIEARERHEEARRKGKKADGPAPDPKVKRARLMLAARQSRDALADAEQRRTQLVSELDRASDEAEALRATGWGLVRTALKDVGVDIEDLDRRKELDKFMRGWRGRAAHALAVTHVLRTAGSRQILPLGLGVAATVLVVLYGAQVAAWLDGAVAWITGIAAAGATYFAPFYRDIGKLVGAMKPIAEEYASQSDKVRTEKRELALKRLNNAEQRENVARQQLKVVEEEIAALLDVDQLAVFVQERRRNEYYRERLGVIARARQDFEQLSRLLDENTRSADPEITALDRELKDSIENLRKRLEHLPKVDRIILYIDDLDRCPEKAVVDVLQAVHLLLAFRLFVVVVGVDPRWLVHSLSERSDVFRNSAKGGENGVDAPQEGGPEGENGRKHWRSTPMDYLEKIFQIPFHLRPMGETGFGNLIDDITRNAPAASTAVVAPAAEGNATVAQEEGGAAGDGPEGPITEGGEAVKERGRPARPGKEVPDPAAGPEAAADPLPTRDEGEAPDVAADDPTGRGAPTEQAKEGVQDTEVSDATASGTGQAARASLPGPRLEIVEWERNFMKGLHPFIASPRSTKRFVNVYRLLRASHIQPRAGTPDPDEKGDTTAGDVHRTALLLLSMLTGQPGPAIAFFQWVCALADEGRAESTTTLRDLLGHLTARVDGKKLPEPFSVDGADPLDSVSAEEWTTLLRLLEASRKALAERQIVFDPELAMLAEWAPWVARYSFRSGLVNRGE